MSVTERTCDRCAHGATDCTVMDDAYICGNCRAEIAADEAEVEALRQQLRGAVAEFVAFLRDCGPASDPIEWHRLMEKHDPEYEQSEQGRARRALERGQ